MRAGAFIVGPRDGSGAALLDMARAIGFQSVARYRGLDAVERQFEATPLIFFLFAGVPRLSRLKPATAAIRFAANPRLRFAPMIYFAPQMSRRQLESCVEMGFDDVITLPYVNGDIGERVFRQVGRAVLYFETPTYFGPDRRGRFGLTREPRPGEPRGGAHKRFEIVRTPELGVSVRLAEDVKAKAPELDAFLL